MVTWAMKSRKLQGWKSSLLHVFLVGSVCVLCFNCFEEKLQKVHAKSQFRKKTVKTSPQLNMKFKACIKFHLKGAQSVVFSLAIFLSSEKVLEKKITSKGAQVRLLHPSCHQYECPSLVVEVPLTTVGFFLSVPLDIHPPNTATEVRYDWTPTKHPTSVSVWLDVFFGCGFTFGTLKLPNWILKESNGKTWILPFVCRKFTRKSLQKVEILNIWKIQV